MEKTQEIFFNLLRAGLWGEKCRLVAYKDINWADIYKMAQAQSVSGLVLAGAEYADAKPPQGLLLQWIGGVQMIEQKNKAMNEFVSSLIERLRDGGAYVLLVKGQGIAQCYRKPEWRACGDVDLFLRDDNYELAKGILKPLASFVEHEGIATKHLGMLLDDWNVEIHGTLYCGLSKKIDIGLDDIKRAMLYDGRIRSWMDGKTQVFLPGADEDAVYVFTHFLGHFYKGGIGLRQICDWCRLLWTYKDSLDRELLESRVMNMGLMSEWKAFGAFAVDYLGMPEDAMPFYSSDEKWKRKAEKICTFVMEVGNMGHNRDNSYFVRHPYMVRKMMSFGRRCSDLWRHARIFPLDTLRFFPCIVFNGIRSAVRGE